jgi:hypothetical protein
MRVVIPERPSAMGRLNAALTTAIIKWSVRGVAIRDGGAAFGFSPIALIAKCMLKQKAPDDAGAQVRQRSGDQ